MKKAVRMKRVKLSIEPDLLGALKAASRMSGESVSGEVRKRLWASFVSPEAVAYEKAWIAERMFG